jgi:hypothetical protein
VITTEKNAIGSEKNAIGSEKNLSLKSEKSVVRNNIRGGCVIHLAQPPSV